MIHKYTCSQYSLRPHARPRNKLGSEATAKLAQRSRGLALGRGGGGDTAVQLASSDGQLLGWGSRANLAINFQVSAKKLSKHLCLYQGRGGKRTHECWQLCQSTPNQSSVAAGLSQAGKGPVTTLSSSRPWRRPPGPGPPRGASLQSPTWSGRSRTSGSRAWAYRQEWSRRR